nr:hypothetical protein [uncultured Hyphomonas sp.]
MHTGLSCTTMQTPLLQRENRRKILLKQRQMGVGGGALGRVPEEVKSDTALFFISIWLIAAGMGRAASCGAPEDKTRPAG